MRASWHCHRGAEWQSTGSLPCRGLAIRPPAEYHSAISGSAKMRPTLIRAETYA